MTPLNLHKVTESVIHVLNMGCYHWVFHHLDLSCHNDCQYPLGPRFGLNHLVAKLIWTQTQIRIPYFCRGVQLQATSSIRGVGDSSARSLEWWVSPEWLSSEKEWTSLSIKHFMILQSTYESVSKFTHAHPGIVCERAELQNARMQVLSN